MTSSYFVSFHVSAGDLTVKSTGRVDQKKKHQVHCGRPTLEDWRSRTIGSLMLAQPLGVGGHGDDVGRCFPWAREST